MLADSDGRRPPLQNLYDKATCQDFRAPPSSWPFTPQIRPAILRAATPEKASDVHSKGKPFFLFFLPFLLFPTFFLRKGRCVTFPPPERNSCDGLLSFSSRSTCHIFQPGLFVVALGSEKTFTGRRRCRFSSNPARRLFFFSFLPLG